MNKEVTRLRNQAMSFSNEGAEFSLNVPDTHEVKELLSGFGKSTPDSINPRSRYSALTIP
jgi:hypothetical protein